MSVNWVFGEVLIGIIVNTAVMAYYYGKLSEKVIELGRRVTDLETLAPRQIKGGR